MHGFQPQKLSVSNAELLLLQHMPSIVCSVITEP